MSNGNGNQTYAERNAIGYNIGEDRFVEYCNKKGVVVRRVGFDEKNGKVPNFFALSETLRQLPDFVVNFDNQETGSTEVRVVAVKGTNKFKEEDYLRLDWMSEQYSTPRAPLYFVFMLRDNAPIWATPKRVKDLYEAAAGTEATWDSDNKKFRILSIGGK
jgi:hypothetical protein